MPAHKNNSKAYKCRCMQKARGVIMSFMRCGYPLKYFRTGKTSYYIFPTDYKEQYYIEDYDTDYSDNKSFVELMARFVEIATENKGYAFKMAKILAKKLGIEKKMRRTPLSEDEWFKKVFRRKAGIYAKPGMGKGRKNEKQ